MQVLNSGVPGYSTVQMRDMLGEMLERFDFAAVVLYPAAWNYGAPAMGRNDLELREELARGGFRRLVQRSAVSLPQVERRQHERDEDQRESEQPALRLSTGSSEARATLARAGSKRARQPSCGLA